MKVSIICLADRPDRLPLFVWSMVAQTHTDWELLIIDQTENPLGVEVMLPILPDDIVPKVKIIRSGRKGDWGQTDKEFVARNIAIGQAFIFPNDDAYYVPTALEMLVKVIEMGADIAICGWLYDLMGYTVMAPSTEVGYIDVGGFMVTRAKFLQVGWPDKGQTGDHELVKAIVETGARVGTYDRVLYVKN